MEMHKLNQWITWKYDGKQKVPICTRDGRKASVADPSTWGTFEDAELSWDDYYGIGFVLTMDDPYCAIDLDRCVDPETGQVAPWADEIIEALNSYTELSPSGTGIHVWVKATKLGPRCKSGAFEMYDSGHYIAFTGRQYGDKQTIESRQDEVNELYRRFFPEILAPDAIKFGEGFQGDDDELLEKMRNRGQWKAFRKLYDHGNFEFYPSQSEADIHLCGILAFWIGPDEDRIEEWFRSSPLADTLDRKTDPDQYLSLTIEKAIAGCDYFYDEEWNSAPPTVRDALADHRMFVIDNAWHGRSGPTDRDVYRALLRWAWKYGQEHGDGIKVSVSDRDLTLQAGLGSNNTARDALNRLDEIHSLIRCVDKGGKRKASTYLLRNPIRAKVHHNLNCVSYDAGSRPPLEATGKIRNAGRRYATIGKRNGQIIDIIYASSEPVSLDELARHLNMRKSDLRRRHMRMLLDEGFIAGDENGYDTPQDIEYRVERFLRESGSKDAESTVKERIDMERRARDYQNGKKVTA